MRHPVCMLVLALLAMALPSLRGSPPPAGESLETRTFEIRDIVRPLPNAELPYGPGDRALIFNGYAIEDVLASPENLYYVGGVGRLDEPQMVTFDSSAEEEPGFFLPWQRSGQGMFDDTETEWRLLAPEALADSLEEHLEAQGFANAECSLEGQRLQVRAPPAALETVESFLGALEREARTRIGLQCILLSPRVLAGIAPGWASEGPYLPDGVFRKALLDPRSRLLSAVARNGQCVLAGSRAIRPLVVDSEVNQTGVIPVNNPVIETPPGGDYLMACPLLLPGSEGVWVDLSVGRLLLDAEQKEVGVDWGKLDFPRTEKRWLSTSAILEPGKVLVAGYLGIEDGLVALVRARVQKPSGPPLDSSMSSHDLTLLLRQSGRTWPGRTPDGRFWSNLPRLPLDIESIRKKLAAGGIQGHLSLDRARLIISGTAGEDVRSWVSRQLEDVCRLMAIDVGVWKVTRAQLATLLDQTKDGSLLEAGWESEVPDLEKAGVDRYAVVGAAGQALGLFGATVKSFAVDATQVSGGTGFAIIQVSDPEIRSAGDGTELWVQAATTSGPSHLRLTVGGLRTRILEERPVVATFPTLEPTSPGSGVSVGSGEEGSAAASAPLTHLWRVKNVTLTLPRQDVRCWSAEVDIPPGRDAILEIDARDGEDTATVLVGRVRSVR